MYLTLKFGAPSPPELLKWDLVEQYHWTLDYIESLTVKQLHEYYQIRDARYKAKK